MTRKNMTDPEAPDFDLDSFLNAPDVPPKLEDDELDELEALMDAHPAGMHMEVLDGFLCALICGPDATAPEEFIPYIFGGKNPRYASAAHENQIRGILQKHWEHIEGSMRISEIYMPFFYSDKNFKVSGNEWAFGFVLGMDKYRESWKALIEQAEKEENLLTPILTLYLENRPANTRGQIHAEDRETIISTLADNLPLIYAHFHGEDQTQPGS